MTVDPAELARFNAGTARARDAYIGRDAQLDADQAQGAEVERLRAENQELRNVIVGPQEKPVPTTPRPVEVFDRKGNRAVYTATSFAVREDTRELVIYSGSTVVAMYADRAWSRFGVVDVTDGLPEDEA